MTAKSHHSDYYPYLGRFNESRGRRAWCARSIDITDYLQVDMGEAQNVCAVATKGSIVDNVWTASYKILLSLDGISWNTFKEDNADKVS